MIINKIQNNTIKLQKSSNNLTFSQNDDEVSPEDLQKFYTRASIALTSTALAGIAWATLPGYRVVPERKVPEVIGENAPVTLEQAQNSIIADVQERGNGNNLYPLGPGIGGIKHRVYTEVPYANGATTRTLEEESLKACQVYNQASIDYDRMEHIPIDPQTLRGIPTNYAMSNTSPLLEAVPGLRGSLIPDSQTAIEVECYASPDPEELENLSEYNRAKLGDYYSHSNFSAKYLKNN